MPFKTYFLFRIRMSEPITAPKGTLKSMRDHIGWYRDWRALLASHGVWPKPLAEKEKDTRRVWNEEVHDNLLEMGTLEENHTPHRLREMLCRVAMEHNAWVIRIYEDFNEWVENPPKGETETLVPEDMEDVYSVLHDNLIEVPVEHWSEEYYRDRMDVFYGALRGETDGEMLFADSENPLTPRQIDGVINLIAPWLDHYRVDLCVCRGDDELSDSKDSYWCARCGEHIHEDALDETASDCPNGRDCSLRSEYGDILEKKYGEDGDEVRCGDCARWEVDLSTPAYLRPKRLTGRCVLDDEDREWDHGCDGFTIATENGVCIRCEGMGVLGAGICPECKGTRFVELPRVRVK